MAVDPARHTRLVERFERAVAAAERAQVEANAKAISDGVDRIVGLFTLLGRRALPQKTSAPQAATAIDEEAADGTQRKRRWWRRRRRFILFGKKLQ